MANRPCRPSRTPPRPDDALLIAERIRASMSVPFRINGWVLRVTTSIGIAVFPDDGGDAATLIKHTDTAMYDAKASGRKGCRYYNPARTAKAAQGFALEPKHRLSHAVVPIDAEVEARARRLRPLGQRGEVAGLGGLEVELG